MSIKDHYRYEIMCKPCAKLESKIEHKCKSYMIENIIDHTEEVHDIYEDHKMDIMNDIVHMDDRKLFKAVLKSLQK